MEIQLISDLHLEFFSNSNYSNFVIPSAPNLAICGDLGYPSMVNYKEFIALCAKDFKKVFIITGNHEYYKGIMKEVNEAIELIVQKYDNVCFLNNKTIVVDDYAIIGSTLWSYIPNDYMPEVRESINDYNYIRIDSTRQLMPQHVNKLYERNVEFLREQIDLHSDKKVIVLTHHLPSFELVDKQFVGSNLNWAFASHSDHLVKPNIVAWLYGHSHSSGNKGIYHINAKGYKNENKKYKKDYVIKK